MIEERWSEAVQHYSCSHNEHAISVRELTLLTITLWPTSLLTYTVGVHLSSTIIREGNYDFNR